MKWISNPRVVKVGGSLFSRCDLGDRLRQWLALQDSRYTVVIAGGGEAVDVLRRLDSRFHLPADVAHELALRHMSINARILAHLLAPLPLVTTLASALRRGASMADLESTVCRGAVLDAGCVMLRAPHRAALPASWAVTSDSIAAYIAQLLGAVELVLLKSTLGESRGDPTAVPLVDSWFPRAAAALEGVRIVDLNASRFSERPWP